MLLMIHPLKWLQTFLNRRHLLHGSILATHLFIIESMVFPLLPFSNVHTISGNDCAMCVCVCVFQLKSLLVVVMPSDGRKNWLNAEFSNSSVITLEKKPSLPFTQMTLGICVSCVRVCIFERQSVTYIERDCEIELNKKKIESTGKQLPNRYYWTKSGIKKTVADSLGAT